MEIVKPIEYKVFSKVQSIVSISIVGLLTLGFAALTWVAWDEVREFSAGVVKAGVFTLIPALVFAAAIRQYKIGLRKVEVSGNTISLIFPNDMLQFNGMQLEKLRVMHFSDEEKRKNAVFFQGTNGKKYTIPITFARSGGRELLEWFKQLEDKQKQYGA
jgi:hypothetical protein